MISIGTSLREKLLNFRDRTFISNKRLGELVDQRLRETAAIVDSDEDQYRPLSVDQTRDLLPIKHSRHLDICYKLWLQNPLAQRLVRMMKNFVIGGSVEIQCDEKLKSEIIDPFWDDFKNNMDLKLPQKIEALSVFGEQIYPVFVGTDGRVRLGYIDPKSVSRVITNPENIEEPVALKIRMKNDSEGKTLKIITIDENPESETNGKLVGDVFYFAINKMPNSTRGYSDILSNMDWLDAYEQFLFNVVERSVFLNMFIWDVLYKNASKEELKEYERTWAGVKPGMNRVHNENVEVKAVTPDLKASDTAELFTILQKHIIGTSGYPLHYFGSGSETNLATAEEMNYPTLKMLQERQKYVGYMIRMILQFVIDQAYINKTSLKEVDGQKAIKSLEFKIKFPELTQKDVTKTASAFQAVANGLAVFSTNGWVSDETAVVFLVHLASNFGLEIDPKEEFEKAKAATDEKNSQDYQGTDIEKIKQMLDNSGNGLDKQIAQLLNAKAKAPEKEPADA